MPLSTERRQEIHETTIRLGLDTANRLGMIAQVKGVSRNDLMNQAILQFIVEHENDSDYQAERKGWIQNLSEVGA